MNERDSRGRNDRRKFLTQVAAAGVAGALTMVAPSISTGSPTTPRGRHFSELDWDRMIGDRFYLCGSPFDESAETAVLVLREVERGAHPPEALLPHGVCRQWCSLIFEVAGPDPITSATHIVEHSGLGRFPAFLNPRPDPRKPFANLCEIGFN